MGLALEFKRPIILWLKNMNRIINIFKIALAVSFLFVMVPNEFFVAPVFMWLIEICFFAAATFLEMLFSWIVLIAIIFLIKTTFKAHKWDDWLCLIAILIINYPVAITLNSIIAHPYFISQFTYLLFIMIECATLLLIITKLVLNNLK